MTNPKPGEVYWVDLGLKGKLRPLLVVSRFVSLTLERFQL
jgi:mRNA-degrading endonuclease toxin of MazEF toxin-antitoxin module